MHVTPNSHYILLNNCFLHYILIWNLNQDLYCCSYIILQKQAYQYSIPSRNILFCNIIDTFMQPIQKHPRIIIFDFYIGRKHLHRWNMDSLLKDRFLWYFSCILINRKSPHTTFVLSLHKRFLRKIEERFNEECTKESCWFICGRNWHCSLPVYWLRMYYFTVSLLILLTVPAWYMHFYVHIWHCFRACISYKIWIWK